ncbi:MAG: hypothetical protein Q8O12_00655, partial [Candidatus Omnitrophota bacterium]|nr:hypothetical protein [Candidatus Omnitrophota bacterium]
QGGIYRSGKFIPERAFAVDCQTWAISVLGPEVIDRWFGDGTAYKMWKVTKERSGYFTNNTLRGVGFSDSHDILSGEWTAGAVMAVRKLAFYYQKNHPEWVSELNNDAITMREGIETLKREVAPGQTAYLYANKRYLIPFGWWANAVLSTASTMWTYFIDKGFDPFVLGGVTQTWTRQALFPEHAAIQAPQPSVQKPPVQQPVMPVETKPKTIPSEQQSIKIEWKPIVEYRWDSNPRNVFYGQRHKFDSPLDISSQKALLLYITNAPKDAKIGINFQIGEFRTTGLTDRTIFTLNGGQQALIVPLDQFEFDPTPDKIYSILIAHGPSVGNEATPKVEIGGFRFIGKSKPSQAINILTDKGEILAQVLKYGIKTYYFVNQSL